ncbi:glutamine synthetase family protein [Trueperella pyogenes]|uniref:Glutamine synthetase n=1 Tax=Trueperella pyogenes TaxID=1661 RepID=X4QMJ7_9ACTO|nr:glutamine synthetase family protein [Trueperella pyogenes]AHU88857.1 glutamine synthetase [Trueperella pyogenes]AJC69705.1 glutamine synthetase [Trueperella pyogenes TP8]ALD74358.1 glutamine synthetase [Trueperella pyogenes]AWA42741.1 glutamine synthetase [Trueperella pyogenes]AWG04767.1 glutamine synthetase [Trueperella pyogenes]
MDTQSEYVLREVDDHDVRFIRLWFTDITGTLKSVAIAPTELEAAFEGGISFDGSAVQGLTRGHESDMVMRPDPSTFQLLSWDEEDTLSARMFCSIYTPDGDLARSDPRSVLERVQARAAKLGFTFYAQPECEFYLFHPTTDDTEVPVPIDNGSYFDHVTRSIAQGFRSRAVKTLEDMGISVEFSHHEIGPGQNEIDLRRTDALTMADQIMTLRVIVEQVAISQGVMASFMPKPLIDSAGSGMHTHFSLFEGNKNAFYDPLDPFHLSKTGRKFVAGLLRHAPEITAITNQHVNSYKRLWDGYEAPNYISWGNSHTSLVRIPALIQDDPESARVEYRAIDSAANPYLAFAVILNAGLAGIEGDYELPEDLDVDVAELTELERRAMGLKPLPASLSDALKEMRQSELVAETLGEDAFDYFLRNKRHEWEAYRHQVTPFERRAFMASN